jgi:hypothetical protein
MAKARKKPKGKPERDEPREERITVASALPSFRLRQPFE